MHDRRKHFRFAHNKTARYAGPEPAGRWRQCRLLNFSREGMSLCLTEPVTEGAAIVLEIPVLGEESTLCAGGRVQWIEKRARGYYAGMAFSTLLDDEAFRKCLAGYHLDQEREREAAGHHASGDGKEAVASGEGKNPFRYPGGYRPSLKGLSAAFVFLLLSVAVPLLFLNVWGYSSSRPPRGDRHQRAVADQQGEKKETHAPVIRDGPRSVVFKESGGSLYALALQHYQKADETIFDLILRANPAITDVRSIGDDQTITLPVITPASYIRKTADGGFRVAVGTFDTFEAAVAHSEKVPTSDKLLLIESQEFSPRDTWYRLTLGEYSSQEEALEEALTLKELALIPIPPAAR